MRLKISHKTRYEYSHPVPYALQQIRLTPQSGPTQTVIDWSLDLGGATAEASFTDQHGNEVSLLSVERNTEFVEITSTGEVETQNTSGVFGPHTGHVPLWHYLSQTDRTRPGPDLSQMIAEFQPGETDPIARLHALLGFIAERVSYDTNTTHVGTTAEIAVSTGSGVCQDHAQIFIAIARALGFPARYVSGYLLMTDRTEQEASHAWAEVHVDGLGWVGFDVSNQISPDEKYVRIATGLDSMQAAPIAGFVYGGSEEFMIVSLQVQQ
ncbi:transglutaminase family protein [Oceanicaulis sp. MMSF_3324]|uniref:transglutaminase family protein n=1 Tax=Oceanicaulis sp. MMSF_3324 TaxID=3046702 RepID=UPI00273E118F|nr:transglutaminase family protein [Oceanicaulis sp. MMSF_3324]